MPTAQAMAAHVMTDAELDAFMDASAVVLGLTIAPEWRAAVRANLAITFRLGAVIEEFELADEAEPAPVFVAACMFARWCQENFFKYMRQHYGLDRLTEYGTEPIPETTRVINPAWRALDAQVRHHNGKLARELAAFAAASLPIDPQPADVQKWELKKATLRSTIEERRQTIQTLKASRKASGRHCAFHDLPPEDQFTRLRTEKKHFIDTLKMIAYRAETALAALVRESLTRSDDARSLLRQLFQSSVDLLPDPQNNTLTVRLHHLASRIHDLAILHLCEELSATETLFPGTNLRLVFHFVGSPSFR